MGEDSLERFSEACGLTGPLRLQLDVPGRQDRSVFEFRRPFLLVGRDPASDLPIDRPEVSRRHAYFQVVAGRIFCVDLCSRTGVHWDDGARAVGWVDRGRGVGIGPVQVRFEGDDAEAEGQGGNLPLSRSFDWPTLPDASLEFLGPEPGREPWQVSRVLVLMGRSPTCRIRLDGEGIGRIHAALVRTPGGIWVVDLHGPEGLRVGDLPVRSARLLEDADEITLGDQRLRIRFGLATPRTSARSDLAKRTSGRAMRSAGTDPDRSASLASDRLPGAEDSLTARLLDEFDRMHRRTTEQFQQAILMMFRMHQDQMDVIRTELSRLDRLEDEYKTLQAEMARGKLPGPARVALRLVSGEALPSNPRSEGSGPRLGRPESAEPPDQKPIAAPPETSGLPGETPSAVSNPTTARASLPPSDSDPHATLAQRIAEIQNERQGLWKRILASLTGDGTDKDLP